MHLSISIVPCATDEHRGRPTISLLHLKQNNSLASLRVGFSIIIDYYASLLIAKYHSLLILIYAIKGEILPLTCHLRHYIITTLITLFQMIEANQTPPHLSSHQREHSREHSQSFYSLEDSRTEFTFIEQPPQPLQTKAVSSKLVNMLGIKQSSALQEMEFSSNVLNQSMHTIMIDQEIEVNLMNPAASDPIDLHQISGIDHKDVNELECSVCLQKEIDCLSLPNQLTPEEMEEFNCKIQKLKQQQSLLRRQISVFSGMIDITRSNNQQLVKQVIEANNFIKKKCQHQSNFPFNLAQPQPQSQSRISASALQQSNQNRLAKVGFKHYDIKPAKNRSASEQQMNYLYKKAALQGKIVLVNDVQNQYRVEVTYEKTNVILQVVNFSRGVTNFVYAAKFNEENQENGQRISQKLQFPLQKYIPKKFTLSLNILLLIFLQNQPKQEQNLQKIEQIRTISVPLPLSYFIQPRFISLSQKERDSVTTKIRTKMFTYEIDINYNADFETYAKMRELSWVKNQWFTMKGSTRLIHLQLSEIQEKENNQKSVVFRVGVKEKDAQEAIDLIQFLCFMLSL